MIPEQEKFTSRVVGRRSLTILSYSFDWRNLYETNIIEIFEKLERDGLAPNQNTIFSINWSTQSYYKKINDHVSTVHLKARLGMSRIVYDFANILYAPYLLKKYHIIPDLVVVHDFPSVFIGLGAKLLWKSKIAIIVTNIPTKLVRSRRFWGPAYLYQVASEFFAKFFVDYAIAISDTTKQYIEKLGIPKSKVRVLALNVIARDKQFIDAIVPNWIHEKYQVPKEKKIVLSVGRLEPEKNFEALIQAFHDFGDAHVVLVIVGQGRLLGNLEELVEKLDMKERIIFAGKIERKEIWNFYRDANLFILLSKSEGLGLVFWEAMYMGVPVIGSRVEGIMESIGADGERGFLVDEKDGIKSIIEKINRCISPDGAAEEMKIRAREYVEMKTSESPSINDLL